MAEQITELGEGWTRDKDNVVRDPEGNIWYGHMVEENSKQQTFETPQEGNPIIQDTGTGKVNVIRTFQCKHPAGTVIPKPDEVFSMMSNFIKESMYKAGLTEDDNYLPRVHQMGRLTIITVVCKPSGTRTSIYEGMKDGDEVVNNVAGQFVRAIKTDNINTLLAKSTPKK